jgi:hypothetical protein
VDGARPHTRSVAQSRDRGGIVSEDADDPTGQQCSTARGALFQNGSNWSDTTKPRTSRGAGRRALNAGNIADKRLAIGSADIDIEQTSVAHALAPDKMTR